MYNESIEWLDLALACHKWQSPEIKNTLGLCYNALGNYEIALQYFEKALKDQDPDIAKTKINISYVYFNMKEYDKSLSMLREALNEEENYPATILYNAGIISRTKGDFLNALDLYKEALLHEKENKAVIYKLMGEACYALGDLDNSDQYYKQASKCSHNMESSGEEDSSSRRDHESGYSSDNTEYGTPEQSLEEFVPETPMKLMG